MWSDQVSLHVAKRGVDFLCCRVAWSLWYPELIGIFHNIGMCVQRKLATSAQNSKIREDSKQN